MHQDGRDHDFLLISRVNTLLQLSGDNLDLIGVLAFAAVGSGDDGVLVEDGTSAKVESAVVTERDLVGELTLHGSIAAHNPVVTQTVEVGPGEK